MSTVHLTPEAVASFFEETKQLFKETDRKFQESNRKLAEMKTELDESFKQVNKIIGDLGNRLGDFVEHSVRPAAVRIFREWGLDVHQVFSEAAVQREGDHIEVDLIVVNEGSVVAIECKSKLDERDIKEHLDRLRKFKNMFPQWADHKLHGAVAAMVLTPKVAAFAAKKGLFVIGQAGENVEIYNEQGFVPATF